MRKTSLTWVTIIAMALAAVVCIPGRAEAAEAKYIYDAAVLPNGHIAVLYISGGQVVLGDFDPSNNKWSKQDIVAGKDAALALDAGGNPHIAYITTTDDLGYTYFDGVSWSTPDIIDSLNFNDVPGVLTFPDIAIDANGYAHIAYLDSKGGYTGGNDYSTYDKDDLMYATNASGSFTRLVRSYSHGWLWSPDGWRNLVNPPPKITWVGDDYCIGVEQYNYDKGMSTQYHDYSYSLLFTPSEPSSDLGFLIRSSTTNSDIFTLYEVDSYGATVYSLYIKSGSLYVTADEDEIPEATKASTVQGADLFAAPTGALYYSSINTSLLLLYQDGEFKEDITLPAAISGTHKRISTVVSAGSQYVLYTDTAGKAWICDVSTESGDLALRSFEIPDKLPVTISGVSVENKTYDGTAVSYTGTPSSVITDGGDPAVIGEYTYTWYDVTAGAALASAPVDAGNYKLIVAVSESDGMYAGSVDVPFTVSPKTISISGIAATNKTYDGTTVVAIMGGALDGLVAGDAVTPIVAATGVAADANAGSGKAVTLADITLSGADAANYTLIQPTGLTVDISQAPLTLTAVTVADRAYDGTTTATVTGVTFGGLQNGETLALGTDYTATAAFADKNAGPDKAVEGSISLSSTTKANNYTLADGSFVTTADITKASGLVATNPSDIEMIKAQVREYSFDLSTIGLNKDDAGTRAYSLGALAGGGIFSPVPFIDDDGTTLRFTSGGMAAGSATQVINISTQNYQDTTATLTFVLVDKTPVTITGVSVESKTYDGTAVSYAGTPSATVTAGGAPVIIDEYTYTWYDVTASAALASAPKDAGPYKLIVAVSVDDSTYTGALDVPFNISKEDIIVKPGDYSIYTGGALPTPEIQYVGLVGGEIGSDVVTYSEPLEMEIRDSEGNPLVSSQISGTYTIVFTNTPVITSTNYDVVTATGTLTISSRPVSGGAPVNSVNIETSDDTTTAKTQATVLGGEASTLLSSADINAIIAEVRSEGSERVVLAPVISTEVKGASLRLPMSSVSSLAVMGLPVTVRSPHAEVTLSGEALAEIGGETGSNLVIETRRNEDSSITVRVRVDDRALDRVNGIKVTIPADSPSASSVLVKVSADGTEEIVKKSACDENGITAILEGSATVKVIRNAKTFQDVQPSHWANGVIAFASSRELFNGTGEGQFSPELAMTRGMFVTVLHRLEGAVSEGNVASFEDVPADAWYAGGVAWALENGITEGVGGGRFAPDESITREQLAVMMFKYAKAMGFDTSVEGDLAVFTDADQVADWAEEAMRYAVGAGLIGGKGQGVLDPKAGATRAEVAAILQRFVVNVVIGL